MSKEVSLFFFYQAMGGGSTSFTVHLFKAFKDAGITPNLYKVRANSEHFERPFSGYKGVKYRNVSAEEALKLLTLQPGLMTAAEHSKKMAFAPDIIQRMLKKGMRAVVHDPNEFKVYDYLNKKKRKFKPFCIRPTMHSFFPEAIFIPHPYVREFSLGHMTAHEHRPHLAVSVARVTFVKRTAWILEMNRLMEHERNHVILRGAENRLYTRHVLSKKYPEYISGSSGYPMTWGASARECERGVFACDFTYFPDDGGGSQYSFMEAWDAGTVNIIAKDWLRYPGEMFAHPTNRAKGNCIAVDGPEQAADWLKLYRQSRRWRDDALEIAERGKRHVKIEHDPVKIAERYWEHMQ
jgi:hypothetical protein